MNRSAFEMPVSGPACMPPAGGKLAGLESGAPLLPQPCAVSKAPLKVCFIGLKCYDHIAGKPVPQYLGGIETQLAVLAGGLRREGCDVSLITFDHGQADRESFDGITVFKSYSPVGGVRVFRRFSRTLRLWAAIRRADADVYLQMGAGDETGLTALGCKFNSTRARRFVFCLASNADCQGPIGARRLSLENSLYRYGIKRATLIVAQTLTQQRNLQQSLGLKSRVIPMAVPKLEDPGIQKRPNTVLWAGRIIPEKRFEWVLEAARRCPEIEFHIAGSPNQPSGYAAELLSVAAAIPNVRAHGRISRSELNKLFQSCALLCCTSRLEGFPTTFLEAWSCGLPVVTTFDPDGIVAREGLGRVVTTVEELVAELREFPNTELYSRTSRAAKTCYSSNFSVETVSRQFHLGFEGLVNR